MPDGGTLTIAMENLVLDDAFIAMNPGTRAGTYVMVNVADSGVGIEPAIRDRIFEPFFTTKETGKGTGLGLSTALGIVKSHGGFINVCSEPGKGTKFKVYLPAQAATTIPGGPDVKKAGLPRGSGELILLVDDEQNIRTVTQKTLERFGYSVLTAGNGVEAVALYAQQHSKVQLVLTDMSMPVMDGPALILALRAINPNVLIIASSGLANYGEIAQAIDGGVQAFIPKPYTAEKLLKLVHAELTGRRE
jgi:CheY-like chemotaxis protein